MIFNFQTKLLSSSQPGLLGKVLNRIHKEQRLLILKRRLWVFSCLLISSLVAIVPVVNNLQADLSASGFWQFTSLIFSDFQLVWSQWSTFSLTILESVPVLNLALFLLLLALGLQFIKWLSQDVKDILALN